MFHNYNLIFLPEFSALSSSETKQVERVKPTQRQQLSPNLTGTEIKEPNGKEIKKPTIKNNCMINKTNLKQHRKWFNSKEKERKI